MWMYSFNVKQSKILDFWPLSELAKTWWSDWNLLWVRKILKIWAQNIGSFKRYAQPKMWKWNFDRIAWSVHLGPFLVRILISRILESLNLLCGGKFKKKLGNLTWRNLKELAELANLTVPGTVDQCWYISSKQFSLTWKSTSFF